MRDRPKAAALPESRRTSREAPTTTMELRRNRGKWFCQTLMYVPRENFGGSDQTVPVKNCDAVFREFCKRKMSG
jgi:hypothetical protein